MLNLTIFQLVMIVLGSAALGVSIGVISVKSYFSRSLMTARIMTYSTIYGRMLNNFLEPDISSINEDVLVHAKLNQVIAPAIMLATKPLSKYLEEYQATLFSYHKALREKSKHADMLHPQVIEQAEKIFECMQKEIGIR